MPALTRVFQLLPGAVVVWIAIGAGAVFRPDVGRRDPRGLGIVASLWAMIGLMQLGTPAPGWMAAIALVGFAAALVIFHWAAFSIRGRLFSYAGNDDLPQFVHTGGPYAYVRNPFYLSYLLVEMSTIALWPSVWGAAFVVLATLYFHWLARYEEAKFGRSPVAEDYERYKARTGRFLPRRVS